MGNTRELLAELLLGSDSSASSSALMLGDAQGWSEGVRLAVAWRVVPQLSARVALLKTALPAAQAFELRRHAAAAFHSSAVRASKGIEGIDALRAEGLRVVAFKGLVSMARLYDGPRERTINDVDLIVRADDVEKAVMCLEARGFARQVPADLEEYAAFVANSPAFAGNQAVTLRGSSGSEIDLHWAVGSQLKVPEILDRAEAARLFQRNFPVASAEDSLLLAARHAVREDFQIESACRDLLDVKLWCAWLAAEDRLDCAMRRVHASAMTAVVLGIARILASYDPASAAGRAASMLSETASVREKRAALALQELFQVQLREGPAGKDLAYLMHGAPARQVIAGLTANWRGYRRIMRAFEQDNLGAPLPLWKRTVGLARSIRKSGLQRFRLVRNLARVKYD